MVSIIARQLAFQKEIRNDILINGLISCWNYSLISAHQCLIFQTHSFLQQLLLAVNMWTVSSLTLYHHAISGKYESEKKKNLAYQNNKNFATCGLFDLHIWRMNSLYMACIKQLVIHWNQNSQSIFQFILVDDARAWSCKDQNKSQMYLKLRD